MAFLPTGELRYAAPGADGSVRIALLTYRLEDGWLITDQASAPKEARSRLRFLTGDRLELTYERGTAVFTRASASDVAEAAL